MRKLVVICLVAGLAAGAAGWMTAKPELAASKTKPPTVHIAAQPNAHSANSAPAVLSDTESPAGQAEPSPAKPKPAPWPAPSPTYSPGPSRTPWPTPNITPLPTPLPTYPPCRPCGPYPQTGGKLIVCPMMMTSLHCVELEGS